MRIGWLRRLTWCWAEGSARRIWAEVDPVARLRCECGRPAVHRVYGGRVRADRDHDLCPKCWRAVHSASRRPPAKDRAEVEVVELPVHREDLVDRQMHLQGPGLKPACGELRPTEITPCGGKLFSPMTTWLAWVECEACREIAAGQGKVDR